MSGGYKGAIASTISGIMQQSQGLSHRGGSLDAVVGIRKTAAANITVSLGSIGAAAGVGSLVSSLLGNTRSGIGIPLSRFGGVEAYRGQTGSFPRTVSYDRPPSATGPGAGGAEGGGAEEAGVD